MLALLLTACGQATSTDGTSPPALPSADASPGETPTTEPPTQEPTDVPTASADLTTPAPTATGSDPSADSSEGAGSAAACTGSDENRDFFASMAAAVDWTVYCPVVPDGWFVEDGQYRLAGGGWMEISYNGPGDARLVLRQGAFCETADGCNPQGSDVGETAFGDRTATFIATGDGGWAAVVDRGATPSWLLVVQGLGETEARTIAANLHVVPG